ncbi:MAG: flagellar biosynthetic protein FliO [Planctomycetota bacterium]
MKSIPKWLAIPPIVGAMLVLGPLTLGGSTEKEAQIRESSPVANPPANPDSNADGGNRPSRRTDGKTQDNPERPPSRLGTLVPRSPDMLQMASAFVGVLLLGAGGLLVLKKLRSGIRPGGGNQSLASLRQTIRLSAKQAVHAIEFEDRILLIGEGDKGLTLLDRGGLPERRSDEATVLARGDSSAATGSVGASLDVVEDGAVPKNLLIPRPPTASQSASARQDTATGLADGAGVPKSQRASLNDFRSLLEKAGR